MKKNIYFLLIDPQRDFCEGGALPVKGGLDAMIRTAQFINLNSKIINDVRVSVDCHQALHIAHPIFWINDRGEHPNVYQVISHDDVQNGVWKPFHEALENWSKLYTKALKENGRYELRIWPPHCIFGTEGWTVVKPLMDALLAWETSEINRIHWIQKGNNFMTEQYSAIRADVPDPMDPTTDINRELITDLNQADEVICAGLALSHCLGGTLWDLSENGCDMQKFTLLTDCTANVDGCDSLGQDYVDKLVRKGLKLSTSQTWKL